MTFVVATSASRAPAAEVTGQAAVAPPTMGAQPFSPADVRLLEGPFRENQARDINYLLSLDPDRLLHMFRLTAGLPSSAAPLGGWEKPECQVRGHSMGHYLSGCALMYAATGDERLKARGDALVAELAACQDALLKQGANAGYLSAFPEAFFDTLDAGKSVWAPWYVIHKIMAGLLDMHLHAGNRQALDVLTRMADWVRLRVDRRTEAQMQQALNVEFGGMGEVLANLYAVTRNPEHLRLARAFDHREVFDPLAAGEDRLDGLHANTQIPKALAAAREYEVSGETRYRDIALCFWRVVALARSFATGGNSDREHFFPVDDFSGHLSPMAQETCNTYNMLKLTRHVFGWEPTAEAMDFYERGLFNHILGSQDPETGTGMYFASLRPGHFKLYATPCHSFWCCTGTGMENPARYGEAIYFHNDRELFVNLFMASRLTWADKGLVVTQETRFPEEDTARLTLSCEAPVNLALRIRWPAWAAAGLIVSVNGRREEVAGRPGSYVTVERAWKDGDRVEVCLPMALRTEALPGDPSTVAVLFGPIVLAGELGSDSLTSKGCYTRSNASLLWGAAPEAPRFATDAAKLPARLESVPGKPLTFRSVGIGRPDDVTLIPYYRLHHQRLAVYWSLCTEAEWRRIAAERDAATLKRQQLEPRIVDEIRFGERSEYEHKLQGDGRSSEVFRNRVWCESARAAGKSLSFELMVKPDRPMRLQCTYWGAETEFTVGMFTGRWSPTGPRAFDILIDDVKIAEQKLTPNEGLKEFFDVDYAIPEELTRGRERVSVTFRAHPDGTAGRLFGCMMLQ